jgi:hypothetical protein
MFEKSSLIAQLACEWKSGLTVRNPLKRVKFYRYQAFSSLSGLDSVSQEWIPERVRAINDFSNILLD